MSRTTLCVVTALLLASGSGAVMIGRWCLLGSSVQGPRSPGTWKVSLVVRGKCGSGNARLVTAVPLDFGRQHIASEQCRSTELLAKPPDIRHPQRRQVLWTPRAGIGAGSFQTTYQCECTVGAHSPSARMSRQDAAFYAPPDSGKYLEDEPRIEVSSDKISEWARLLCSDVAETEDRLGLIYRYVDHKIANEPLVHGQPITAVQCLERGSGDAAAKARLLVALCRNRGIPARLVSGVCLKRGQEQPAHVWAEAWVHDLWVPVCPFNHHLGWVPSTYLVFSQGDLPLVHGRNVHDLEYAFYLDRPMVESAESKTVAASWLSVARLRWLVLKLSLYQLPPPEQRLVEFLLLVPIAALMVCVYRNVIGLATFGTFSPALVGLAFRDLGGIPGILVFVSIVLIGWLFRRILDRYHLLQVPRMAFLLSMVVIVLITAIQAANFRDLPATRYVSLFPIVILTGMIERFWTLEVEEGTASSFRTLLTTLLIAASISLVLSFHAVVRHMFRFPETLGLIMAAQLLIGRYTGFRLLELFRFRDLLAPPQPA
jgi:hypothetical protein